MKNYVRHSITVITVSCNAVNVIEKTIRSVIGQQYKDFEYIVVDGNSQDGTVDIIRRYEAQITRWISEPDTGIYNAMNKAVRMASGDYCIFMNAGDLFVDSLVLTRISSFLNDEYDVVIGNEISVKKDRIVDYVKAPQVLTFNHLYNSSLCHQASFIKRSLLLEYPYDENLRLVSDWKFWIQTLIMENASYLAVDVDVCVFNREGLTYTRVEQGIEERKFVLSEIIPLRIRWDYEKFNHRNIVNCFCNRVKRRVKRIIRLFKIREHIKVFD